MEESKKKKKNKGAEEGKKKKKKKIKGAEEIKKKGEKKLRKKQDKRNIKRRSVMADTRGTNNIPIQDSTTSLFKNLQNSWIKYNGYLVGRTIAGPVLSKEDETIDINYQQGSKGKMTSNQNYTVTVTLIDTTSDLFSLLIPGWKKVVDSTTKDFKASALGLANLYKDHYALAKPLQIIACKDDGVTMSGDKDTITFYKAYPQITGELLNFTRDDATGLEVTFDLYVFEIPVSMRKNVVTEKWDGEKWVEDNVTEMGSAFGYIGTASDVPIASIEELKAYL